MEQGSRLDGTALDFGGIRLRGCIDPDRPTPLVGYLVAGFVLNGFGVGGTDILSNIADAGVTLLLFTIGLKLKLKTLARPEVWGGTTAHMLATTIIFFGILTLVGTHDVAYLNHAHWQTGALAAFALSFSSTVFAVNVFEEKKEMPAINGQFADIDKAPHHGPQLCFVPS